MNDRDAADVLVVVGTRPEAIKMAPVMERLRAIEGLRTRLVLTGQHTDLVDRVLETFGLTPDHDLDIMREDQSLHDVAIRCLAGLRPVFEAERPRLVLVQGDTATVFFAALSAFFKRTRVGHVEAGLRSHDRWSPFPEEMLRRLTDEMASLHFAPTSTARDHLLQGGADPDGIHVTGNTVVDALETLHRRERPVEDTALKTLLESGDRIVLLTAHRRESFGDPMREVFRAVRTLADDHPGTAFLYPVHPNPRVHEAAREILSDHPSIHLTEPLGYFDLLKTLSRATLVLTDSGGIQEEAPSFDAPVLVLRELTERPEGIEAGVAKLVGTDADVIVQEAGRLLRDEDARREMAGQPNPYGDGRAAERIADVVAAELLGRARETADWDGTGRRPE